MREGWKRAPMGELCTITSGKSNTQDAVDDGEYAFFDRSKTPKRSSRYLYDQEALIIPGEGTEFIPRHFIGKFDLHQRAYALFDFTPEVDVRYLYYYLIFFKDWFVREAVGATVKSLRRRHFTELPVVVAPIAEQKRIVAILDEAFEGIDGAVANAERNLAYVFELFESYLNSIFRLSGDRESDSIPLSQILAAQPRNGWSPPAKYQTGSGNPVLTLSSVTGFRFDGSKVKWSSAPTHSGAHYWLRPGELLMTRSNTRDLVGHVAIYDGGLDNVICCDLIMKMTVDPAAASARFVYYWLRSARMRDYITSRATGASSTMKKIRKSVVQGIPVPHLPLDTQHEIVEACDDLSRSTSELAVHYERKLANLSELRQSILQKAFSGKLTAKEVDKEMAAA